ncbi:MAG: alpha/beta hydrolase [Gammaproteobacteria bacterium]|nr:alpha/beta hydrolase [Gammaproteobacteria bacterium]
MNTHSIDEGLFVTINGTEQWMVLRGSNVENPAMLIISGPGVALSSIAPFFEAWEQDFTLVHWDQPWAGATYSANPVEQGPLSLDRLVKDGIAVSEYVRQRINADKIAVLGISAGSIVGLKMMQERAEIFSAYIGTGQFVNWAEQDALSYRLLLEKAQTEGNEEAQRELQQIGLPPYEDSSVDAIKSKYHSAMTEGEMAALPVFSALMMAALTNPPPAASYIPDGVALKNPRELATQAYAKLRPELLTFDAYALPKEFTMPIFFFQGDQDYYSVTSSVQAYENEITAPKKNTVVIEGGSHSVIWLREQFLEELNRHVRPLI